MRQAQLRAKALAQRPAGDLAPQPAAPRALGRHRADPSGDGAAPGGAGLSGRAAAGAAQPGRGAVALPHPGRDEPRLSVHRPDRGGKGHRGADRRGAGGRGGADGGGRGPLRAPLSRAHPQLRFTGWLDRAGMLAEAQQARAVVMPSRYPEPFGLVAAEAVLSGLPVILSEPALLAPEIAAQGLGWACDTRDPAAFAALLRLVADLPPAALRQVSEAGFGARAGLCLTTDAWCDGLLELYAGVTGSLAAGPG
ncbi:glycosyltransferase [Rhodobacter capsulatus]|uniref:glycosyltransferase n=1 Tax=Rhodobacter capsulatus TaxID=1061 RepID=UPI00402A2ACC